MARLSARQLRQWKSDIASLRCYFPPILPVRVYRRPMRAADEKHALGHTSLRFDKRGRPSHFVIVVSSTISWDAAWQVLLHEWAHAVAWREGHETVADHDPEWAIAMGRIWQELVEP